MQIKPYRPGDETLILQLFELSFGKKMSLEYWNWRFLQNPFTSIHYIDLMWDGDILVGHYAVSPVEMIVEGKKVLTALSMTTMTHPEYSGKGIFTKLAESLYQRIAQDGFEFVWGFPNNNSHYGFIKNLNWSNISLQGMMHLKIDDFKLISSPVHFDSAENFDSEIFKNFIPKKSVSINKSSQYLNWRYISNPSNKYKVLINEEFSIWVVYKLIQISPESCEIDIMEIEFNENPSYLAGIIQFITENEICPISQFNIWDSIFSSNQLSLEKSGFRVGAPVTYLGARCFNNLESIIDFKNWDISFGNSDVF